MQMAPWSLIGISLTHSRPARVLRRQLIIFTLHILRTISQHHTVWGSSKGPRHSYSPEDTPQVLVFKKDDMFTYYNTYIKFGTISKYNLS